MREDKLEKKQTHFFLSLFLGETVAKAGEYILEQC